MKTVTDWNEVSLNEVMSRVSQTALLGITPGCTPNHERSTVFEGFAVSATLTWKLTSLPFFGLSSHLMICVILLATCFSESFVKSVLVKPVCADLVVTGSEIVKHC